MIMFGRKLHPRICGKCGVDLSRDNHEHECPYYDPDFDEPEPEDLEDWREQAAIQGSGR